MIRLCLRHCCHVLQGFVKLSANDAFYAVAIGENQPGAVFGVVVAVCLVTEFCVEEEIFQAARIASADVLQGDVMSSLGDTLLDPVGGEIAVGNPEIMQDDLPALLLPLGNLRQVAFSGESRLKGEGLFLTEFSSSCCKKSLAARRFSAAISSGESPRAISSGVEECPRVYNLGQEAHGEGGLSYAIGPCDDVADLRGHSSWRKRFRCPAPGACRICRAVLRR